MGMSSPFGMAQQMMAMRNPNSPINFGGTTPSAMAQQSPIANLNNSSILPITQPQTNSPTDAMGAPTPMAPSPMGFQFPGLINFDRPGQSNAYGNSASLGGLSSMFGMPRQDPSKMMDIANGGQGLIDLLKAGAAKPGQYHMDIGPVPKTDVPGAGNKSNGFDPSSLLGPLGIAALGFGGLI